MYLPHVPISSGYGPRPQFNDFHYGVDFACGIGTPLPALVAGTIVFEGYIGAAVAGYPNELIVILQADGYFIVYGHLSRTMVNAGQRVNQGDIIALSGNSGFTSGAHLHIEKRKGTKAANKGLSAYPAEDITSLLNAYGQSSGGGNTGGSNQMTQEEHAKEVVRLILDVVESEPHYEEKRPEVFMNHVRSIMNDPQPLGDRRWAKGIMTNNGVLNGPNMAALRESHDKALGQLDKENSQIRNDFAKKTQELEGRLSASDEVNQILASEANGLKATNKGLVEESKTLKARIKELESQPGTPGQPEKALEDYSSMELIRIAINRFLKGTN